MKKLLYITLLFSINLMAQEQHPYDLIEVDGKLLTVNDELLYKDNCITLYADETPLDQITFSVNLNVGKKLYVNWGDGTIDEYTGTGSNQYVISSYTKEKNNYTIKIYGDFKEVNRFYCKINSNLSGNADQFILFENITILQFDRTGLSGNVSEFKTLVFLTNLRGYSTPLLMGDVSELKDLVLLGFLRLHGNPLITFDNEVVFDIGGTSEFQNCNWSTASVDNCLNSYAAGTKEDGTLNVAGTNHNRSPDSDDAMTELEDRGWTITVNEE